MQSLRILTVFVLLTIAAAQPGRLAWDPTTRDRTSQCLPSQWTPPHEKCNEFNKCCSEFFDPLNGDKCQNFVQNCQENEDGEFEYTCTFSNCTEMITTTTTTTTQAPRVNAAPGASLFVFISAMLHRFLF